MQIPNFMHSICILYNGVFYVYVFTVFVNIHVLYMYSGLS